MNKTAAIPAIALMIVLFCAPARAASHIQSASADEIDGLLFGREGPVVVVGMASWCGPCKEELPDLIAVYDELKGKGLTLYGLSIDFEGAQAMQAVVDAYGVNFPVVWGGEEAMRRYELFPIPMMLLVRDGKIVERISGKSSKRELKERLGAYLP